jgi:hypothetical protein
VQGHTQGLSAVNVSIRHRVRYNRICSERLGAVGIIGGREREGRDRLLLEHCHIIMPFKGRYNFIKFDFEFFFLVMVLINKYFI